MATHVPYLVFIPVTLAASGTGTGSYTVPQGQALSVKKLFFQSTGAFKVTSIRSSGGLQYTNASGSAGIPSLLLNNAAAANIGFNTFDPELFIDGGKILYIDVLDTSAAPNTVNLLLPSDLLYAA